MVVDTGFSFTHIVPYCRSRKMKEGIRRSDQSCDRNEKKKSLALTVTASRGRE